MKACAHCGAKPAPHAWPIQLCADRRRRRVPRLCGPCDRRLNLMMLRFFNIPDAEEKAAAYFERQVLAG